MRINRNNRNILVTKKIHEIGPFLFSIFVLIACLFVFGPIRLEASPNNIQSFGVGKDTPENAAINAYYHYVDVLSATLIKITNNETLTNQEMQTSTAAAQQLNNALTGFLDDKILSPDLSKKVTGLNEAGKAISHEAEKTYKSGKHKKAALLSSKSKFCFGLGMKAIAEEYLEQNHIEYTKIKIEDAICFQKSVNVSEEKKVTIPRNADSLIQIDCRKLWKTDYQMVQSCIIEQKKAKNSLSGYNGPNLERCIEKWGNDFKMIKSCVDTTNSKETPEH
jgi:hypothetical protein